MAVNFLREERGWPAKGKAKGPMWSAVDKREGRKGGAAQRDVD